MLTARKSFCVVLVMEAREASNQGVGRWKSSKWVFGVCAGGNLVSLLCAAAIKVEEDLQADERAKIKKIDDWYKKLGACRQAKADAEWLATLEQRK